MVHDSVQMVKCQKSNRPAMILMLGIKQQVDIGSLFTFTVRARYAALVRTALRYNKP